MWIYNPGIGQQRSTVKTQPSEFTILAGMIIVAFAERYRRIKYLPHKLLKPRPELIGNIAIVEQRHIYPLGSYPYGWQVSRIKRAYRIEIRLNGIVIAGNGRIGITVQQQLEHTFGVLAAVGWKSDATSGNTALSLPVL